jgi:hypothetical protein
MTDRIAQLERDLAAAVAHAATLGHELQSARTCSTCLGDPHSHISKLLCVCENGTREGEVMGLRKMVVDAEREAATLGAQVGALRDALAEALAGPIVEGDTVFTTEFRERLARVRRVHADTAAAAALHAAAIRADERARMRSEVRAAIEPVLCWYESDEHQPPELLATLREIVLDLQADRAENLRLRRRQVPS